MKHLKGMLTGFMPIIEPDQMVEAIGKRNGLIRLEAPQEASSIRCPDCGSVKGYYNPGWKAWCCAEDNCIGSIRVSEEKTYFNEPPIRTMESFEIPEKYNDASFANCLQEQDRKNMLLKWSWNPQGFLLFAGLSGRGKTYAACCCIDALRKKNRDAQMRFSSVSTLYSQWRKYKEEGKNELALIDKYSHLSIFILDDLGQRTPTDSFLEFLYMLINARDVKNRGTIITSNLPSAQMIEKLGDAITSRICSGSIFRFDGKDRRISDEKK